MPRSECPARLSAPFGCRTLRFWKHCRTRLRASRDAVLAAVEGKLRMVDFAQARRTMVDGQVRTSDVTDLRLIAAMLDVPREAFVPAGRRAIAYLDIDVPVGAEGTRALLKPMVLAKLIQAAGIDA